MGTTVLVTTYVNLSGMRGMTFVVKSTKVKQFIFVTSVQELLYNLNEYIAQAKLKKLSLLVS